MCIRGSSPSGLELRDDETLAASDRHLSIDSETLAAPDGGRHAAAFGAPLGEAVELGEVIGRGGMGVVQVGLQPSLRREVAVKSLHGPGTTGALAGLLKEAWVGGTLEHPGLVPVHALAPHEFGVSVVMKRVEGDSWQARLRTFDRGSVSDSFRAPEVDPESATEMQETEAPERSSARGVDLESELRVFIQVCHAVAYAHSRGVLHLDLKPQNVMLGAFGEVYVVDWGLAAGMEGAPDWLPRASGIARVAGTPEYMAPELAKGVGAEIAEHSDVYLMGAILHEIVTGQPPHRAPHILGRLYKAFLSEPCDYEALPDELAAILHRAMHRDPAARFASVNALREAVESFLEHRSTLELLAVCRRGLATVEAAVDRSAVQQAAETQAAETQAAATQATATPAAATQADAKMDRAQSTVRDAFVSSRFALSAAAEAWPEHPELEALHERLHHAMARWAIGADRAELAEAYVGELRAPHPELTRDLDALRARERTRAAHVRKLERLEHDHDLQVGSKMRRGLGVALGLVFIVVNVSMGYAERASLLTLGYPEMGVTGAAVAAFIAPYTFFRRKLIFQNHANAAVLGLCICTFFVVQAHWLVCFELDLAFQHALTLTPLYYLLAFGAFAVLVDLRFFVGPLLQIPTLLLANLYPEWAYEIIGLGGGLSAMSVGLAYRPENAKATS